VSAVRMIRANAPEMRFAGSSNCRYKLKNGSSFRSPIVSENPARHQHSLTSTDAARRRSTISLASFSVAATDATATGARARSNRIK
jgi:hypothetical protein